MIVIRCRVSILFCGFAGLRTEHRTLLTDSPPHLHPPAPGRKIRSPPSPNAPFPIDNAEAPCGMLANRSTSTAQCRCVMEQLEGEIDLGSREERKPPVLGIEQVSLMQRLAQEVTVLRPEVLAGGATVGELAWQFGKDSAVIGDRWRYRLWPRPGTRDQLDAWAWMSLPFTVSRSDGSSVTSETANLTWQVHPNHSELLDDILDWFAGQAAGLDQSVIPQDGDADMLARLPLRGYTLDADEGGDDGLWHQFNRRSLEGLERAALPHGFHFRTAAEVGPMAATRAHVEAWYPSTFNETSMAGVQAAWPYSDDLHVLIEAPDGRLVASAIIWFDPVSRTAEFEPVGTHRAFRRRGLATALMWHGMQKARDAGAETMLVACVGAAGRPAARDLYYSVGFQPFARDVPYIKRSR